MDIDFTPLLKKQVTFPVLCYLLHILYKDLSDVDAGTNASSLDKSVQDDSKALAMDLSGSEVSSRAKWKPVELMESIRSSECDPEIKDWLQTDPHPYKPFKPGEYRLTMGVRPMPFEYWFVFENTWKKRVNAKWDIIKKNYKDVIFHVDPAMVNCDSYDNASVTDKVLITPKDVELADRTICEAYEHITGYLLKRYPQYFEILLSPDDTTPGVLVNKILKEYHPVDPNSYLLLQNDDVPFLRYRCFNTDIIPVEISNPSYLSDSVGRIALVTTMKTRRAHELILALQRMVEEDLILLTPNENRQFNEEYILMTGCFAFAAGFNPRERFMKPLTQVHGPVPEYKTKLQSQMNKFFQTHKYGKLVMRLNFSFQTHSSLYVTDDNKGTKDEVIRAKSLEELNGGRDLHYRSERQCLMKLRETGSMCFSIKTYLWNMEGEFLANEFYSQQGVVQDLIDAVRGMQDTLGQYKRRPEWGSALLEMLESRIQTSV